ncbi:MAG: radical SAM protein, partial [Thermodesulfovibrionia bacterium]|nr:radical SAM protein [Thermodesulfovibrionia bacterium]
DTYLAHISRAHFFLNGSPEIVKEQEVSLKRLHLNITGRCNLTCVHCGVANSFSRNESLEKEKVFEIINELSEKEGAALAISGGEPLVHKDCLEILEYASKRVKTSLSTNATLIDEKIARDISSFEIGLQISLDGPEPFVHDRIRGEGNFDNALMGIRLLRTYGCTERISLFVTVMKQNIDSIPDIIRFAEEMEIPSIRFLPVQRLGNARTSWIDIAPRSEEYSRLYEYLYREMPHISINISAGFQGFLLEIPDGCRWCHLGDTMAINSSGDIYPCSLMMHPDFHIGNIHQMNLKEALESEQMRNLTETCSSREKVIKKCNDCHWKHFCQASCPGSVFFQKGSLWDTDELCDLRQRLYPEVIFDMAEKRGDAPVFRKSIECEI